MQLKIFIALAFFISNLLFSQESKTLNIATLKNANAVVVNNLVDIQVLSETKLKKSVNFKAVIFNKQGDDLADPVIYYDKNTKVISLTLSYYNIDGRLIKKIHKSGFHDVAASGNSTLYSDNRALYYHYTPTVYPYIVHLEYTVRSNDTALIDPWYPYPDYNTGVDKSVFRFTYPEGFKLYKIEKNLKQFNINIHKEPLSIKYTATNLPPLTKEPYSPDFSEIVPFVRISLNKFQLAGVLGTANSWNEFGAWMQNRLLKGRDVLPVETVHKIKNLVQGINDPIEKAKIIYDYVQKKTRYINVAIGIGGWQPMPASDVDKLGYGDCKALTNYTKSLLDAVHVQSYYTIAYAGNQPKDIDENLVGIQGNHVLLCIPTENDSIWLECTSQKLPFGFVNSFTDNRKVLAITPTGSKIVKTKSLKPEDNLQKIQAAYNITENGDINAKLTIKSYGDQYNKHLFHFDGLSLSQKKEAFANFFDDLHAVEFDDIQTKNNKKQKVFEEKLVLKARDFASKLSDTALIFTPNAFNKNTYVPPRIRDKKYPFVINRGFKDEDIYTITFPENYTIDALPEDRELKNEFGLYKVTFKKINPHQILYHRILIINQGHFPKSSYRSYRKFRKKLKKSEQQKILITKS